MSAIGTSGLPPVAAPMSANDPKASTADFLERARTIEAAGETSRYSPASMALSSWKRIAPSLLLSEITKRTRPCFEVSA